MDPGFPKKERGQEQITPALSSFWGNRGDSNPRPSESQNAYMRFVKINNLLLYILQVLNIFNNMQEFAFLSIYVNVSVNEWIMIFS